MKTDKLIMIVPPLGLMAFFVLLVVAAACIDSIGIVSSPHVSTIITCPDGSPKHVVIPVDCLETCGVHLPAEKEIEKNGR